MEHGRHRTDCQRLHDRRRRRRKGSPSGATGDAILSAGAHASIGPITNRGQIIGNVEIDNQASVTVAGGGGKTFGRWTGGAITIGDGDLTFAGGATALGDDVSVDGGAGTVTNMASLRIGAPQTITGSFMQTVAGVLDLDFGGDVFGQYGALTVSKLTMLDGGLAIDLTGTFTLTTGDRFDILGFGGLTGQLRRAYARRRGLHDEAHGFVGLQRRRAIERGDQRHVAGPRRGACLGGIRPGGQLRRARTLNLGDAGVGLPRPRRARTQGAEKSLM
jgi:hypothetical protein